MDTMNALVWKGDGALSLERRPIPALQGPRDAIVRVTRSTICTSDLHIRSGAGALQIGDIHAASSPSRFFPILPPFPHGRKRKDMLHWSGQEGLL